MPRWMLWLLALLAGAALVAIVPMWGSLHVYEKHFRGDAAAIELKFDALSAQMDEAAVRALFPGSTLRCLRETGLPLGDRACDLALKKANGLPALSLGLFFREGRLRHAIVHVPWWAHGRVHDRLVAQWGRAEPSGLEAPGWPVDGWTMASGKIEMNQRRARNPLRWSTVMWSAGGA